MCSAAMKAPLGLSLLRKRGLLKTRRFRQDARKYAENFGKKREGWTVPALLTRSNIYLALSNVFHNLVIIGVRVMGFNWLS